MAKDPDIKDVYTPPYYPDIPIAEDEGRRGATYNKGSGIGGDGGAVPIANDEPRSQAVYDKGTPNTVNLPVTQDEQRIVAEYEKADFGKTIGGIPSADNTEYKDLFFAFDGAWFPSEDGSKIGGKNFKTLTNMRYNRTGIEGVQGYTYINTSACNATYCKINNGHHHRSQYTTGSYVLVQAEHSSDPSSNGAKVYYNSTAIPSQGAFTATELHQDVYGNLMGRFSEAPGGNMAYCNGYETCIWGGTEIRLGGLFGVSQITNALTDVTFAATTGIKSTASNFKDLGYGAKMTVTVTGTTNNNHDFVIATITDDSGTFNKITTTGGSPATVNEGPGNATLTVNPDTGHFINPIDYTDVVTDGSGLTYTGSIGRWIILSTRPLQGATFYLHAYNSSSSSLAVKYWNGSTFTAVSNLSDGTVTGGKSMAQSGSVTWTSTVGYAKPFHFEGLYLYAYHFLLSAGTTKIYHCTGNAPFQNIVDVWDGVYRQPITFQVYKADTSTYEDYTLEVNETSSSLYPIGAELDGLTTSDYVLIGFEERVSAIQFDMIGGYQNTNASAAQVYYWTGTAWAAPDGFFDRTNWTGASLGNSAEMHWTSPAYTSERTQTLFGVTGYFYKVTWNQTLSGTAGDTDQELLIDLITGIPAQLSLDQFKFPVLYKGRLLLCGNIRSKKANRVDYSMTYAPDVYNGEESSMNGVQSLYFGGSDALTCGTSLYNRFGSNIFTVCLMFKDSEMYILDGDGPDNFKIYTVSTSIGCPAPLTLVTAEVGYQMDDQVVRNVAIWMSHSGPMMFDGAVLSPIPGIENYFDPVQDECIRFSYMEVARAWYDSTNKEYNLLIPSGASATINNVWLVYSLEYKKWYLKDTDTAAVPQCGWPVVDLNGNQYTYAGLDTGIMVRLENGNCWYVDGGAGDVDITQTVETGDFLPTGNLWDETTIKKVKFVGVRVTEAGTEVAMTHYAGTSSSGTSLTAVDLTDGSNRLVKSNQNVSLNSWIHSFKFVSSTGATAKGLQPIGWGIRYIVERKDE